MSFLSQSHKEINLLLFLVLPLQLTMQHNIAWLQKETTPSAPATIHSSGHSPYLQVEIYPSSETKPGLKQETFPIQSPEGSASGLTHSTIALTLNSCFILCVWISVSLTSRMLMNYNCHMSGRWGERNWEY